MTHKVLSFLFCKSDRLHARHSVRPKHVLVKAIAVSKMTKRVDRISNRRPLRVGLIRLEVSLLIKAGYEIHGEIHSPFR